MALTRKFLSALGIEADKIDQIIEAHTETTDALKEQRDQYKADAEKLPDVQKELDAIKADYSDGETTYKEKYEKEHTAFENYKTAQNVKETRAKKTEAYKNLLKEAGVSEKHINAVLRVADLNSIEFDDEGKVKDSDKQIESIKTDWSDFITTTRKEGAKTSTPPENNGGSKLSADAEYARARFSRNYAAKYGEDKSGQSAGDGNNNGGNE